MHILLVVFLAVAGPARAQDIVLPGDSAAGAASGVAGSGIDAVPKGFQLGGCCSIGGPSLPSIRPIVAGGGLEPAILLPASAMAAPKKDAARGTPVERPVVSGGILLDAAEGVRRLEENETFRAATGQGREGPAPAALNALFERSGGSEVRSERTAMARHGPSVPTRLVKPFLRGTILDYGAGRGEDAKYLKAKGFQVKKYDPFYSPKKPSRGRRFNWVLLNYVLNVIASPTERAAALGDIHDLLKPRGRLLVSVRAGYEIDASRGKGWRRLGDGWITSRGTFQRGYTPRELEALLEENGFRIVNALSPLMVIAEKEAAARDREPGFGKRTPHAVYVHRSLAKQAPLRLKGLVERAKKRLPAGARWNLVKIAHDASAVSFLWYPEFDSDPHPALRYGYRVDLGTGKMRVLDHRSRANPFILHRKDSMVGPGHPLYGRFKRLTEKEEAAGLLGRSDIGTRQGWEKALKERRVGKRPTGL